MGNLQCFCLVMERSCTLDDVINELEIRIFNDAHEAIISLHVHTSLLC